MSPRLPYPQALEALPPTWSEDVLPEIRSILAESAHKVFILDDDPTGTQTVRDLIVVTNWDIGTLSRQWERRGPGCFILTNSRALTEQATRALHREIATNLHRAAEERPSADSI